MEKNSTYKNQGLGKERNKGQNVSEPLETYETTHSISEKTYTHEEVFGKLRRRLKEFYKEK